MAEDEPGRVGQELIKRRLLEVAAEIEESSELSILYQHTVFCQTGLPYRNPGDLVRIWKRTNGSVGLQVEAGTAWKPDAGDFVQLGLPWGTKPRLVLAHLNGEALRQQSPEIELDTSSLTGFVRRLGLDTKGRNILAFKDQLSRLSAASIRLGMTREGEAVTIKSDIVSAFNLWWPKDERQRVLWPTIIRLSAEYFQSLQRHAVPLHDRSLAALSGSAMGLDVYAWLAQRLHRVDPLQPVLIGWPALHGQFGWHYTRLRKFREVFSQTVRLVLSQYRAARIELGERGMTLRNSPPPVKGRTAIIIRTP